MKHFFKQISVILLLNLSVGWSISQNPIWTLPNNYLSDGVGLQSLPTTGNPTIDYNGQQSNYAHNAGYNPVTGELMFFIVDGILYDNLGYRINILGDGITTHAFGISDINIVPNPGNCKQYYIFCSFKEFISSSDPNSKFKPAHAYYAILDLDKTREVYNTSRKGELLGAENFEVLNHILDDVPSAYHLLGPVTKYGGIHTAVTPKRTNGDHLVLFQLSNDFVYTFNLSSSGLQFLNVFDPINAITPTQHDGKTLRRSELEIIPYGSGYRVAGGFAGSIDSYDGLFVYDIDYSGDYINNTRKIYALDQGTGSVYMKGIEFSPDGELIYFTHNTNTFYTKAISCINVSSWNLVTLSNIPNAQAIDFQYSQLELAQDGKIYAATSNRLATINNPNNGASSTWTNNALGLSNYNTSSMYYSPGAWVNLYSLPSQIDKQDCVTGCFDACSTSDQETACCVFYSGVSTNYVNGYTVSNTTTWSPGGTQNNPFGATNGVVYFSGNLVIPAGKVLNLNGMTLHFTPDAKVIVQRGTTSSSVGGKLILNGSTLTVDDNCGKCLMWPGVEVHGYNNVAQGFPNTSPTSHNSPQGAVYVLSDSRIEHALRGITAGLVFGTNGTVNPQYAGGMIGTSQSTFFNNQIDVEFATYTLSNKSYFHRTTFKTVGLLNDEARLPNYHLGVFGVNNINVRGCTFINETPTLFPSSQQGIGIASMNSRFFVDEFCTVSPCSNPIRSTFENLSTGVVAGNFLSTLTYTIDRSDFINNHTGIYTSAVNNQIIQRNTFEVYKSVAPNYTFATIGVHLLNCTGYRVQENDFEEYNDLSASGQGNTIGILVDNSGTSDNQIYKNSFRNLRVGGQSQRINSELYNPGTAYPNDIGLRWKCNTFSQDMYEADLSVTSGRIAYQQGYCLPVGYPNAEVMPAGNKFSHSANNPTNDFWMEQGVLPLNYAHHADLSTTPIDYTTSLLTPQHCSPSGDVFFNETTSCPSRIRAGGIIVILADINLAAGMLQDNITYKEGLIDGGDTEYLLSQIANTSLSNETKMNLLLDASPYLTDDVLIAYLNSTPPDNNVDKVISANSPVTDNVWAVVDGMDLPSGIKDQLEDLQTGGMPAISVLLNERNYEKNERNLLINELISTYLLDTTLVGNLDSVEVIINQERDGIELNKRMTELYLAKGDYVNAQNMLNAYVTEYGYDNYCKLLTYVLDYHTTNDLINLVVSDTNEREAMESIADDESDLESCTQAQSLLETAFNRLYPRLVESLNKGKGMMMPQDDEEYETQAMEKYDAVRIFPNPAQGEFFVVIDMASENLNNVDVALYTLTGQKVKHVTSNDKLQLIPVDVNNLSEGMYLVIVTVDGAELSRKKVSVK